MPADVHPVVTRNYGETAREKVATLKEHLGLAVIAVGIVVDESIVVTDSIQRHLDRGRPAREAAIDGLGEIHLAVLAGGLGLAQQGGRPGGPEAAVRIGLGIAPDETVMVLSNADRENGTDRLIDTAIELINGD